MNPEQETQACEKPREISNRPVGVPTSAPNLEVYIIRVENGYIVRVGCKTFCFPGWSNVSEALEFWFKNPEEAQKKYCRN